MLVFDFVIYFKHGHVRHGNQCGYQGFDFTVKPHCPVSIVLATHSVQICCELDNISLTTESCFSCFLHLFYCAPTQVKSFVEGGVICGTMPHRLVMTHHIIILATHSAQSRLDKNESATTEVCCLAVK